MYVTRISWRHHAVYVLLSLLTVYIFNLFAQMPRPNIAFWGCPPCIGMLVWLATEGANIFVTPRFAASKAYCVATTYLLLHLHEGVTAIGGFALE